MNYLLIPLTALILVAAQATWGGAIKQNNIFSGSLGHIISGLFTNSRIWLGGLLYVVATLSYFIALSKNNFFVVQVSMTGIALILSTILAKYYFHENLSTLNLAGMIIVIIGVGMVAFK